MFELIEADVYPLVSQSVIPSKKNLGASLKDLGKKWFAFSKIDKDALKVIEKLQS